MNKETLKTYRIFIPGIFLLIFSLPLVKDNWVFNSSIFTINNSEVNFWGYIFIIVVLGVILLYFRY